MKTTKDDVDRAWRYSWIEVPDAMTHLGVGSRSSLYDLIREHRLPHGRRGGKYVFRRADLDAWVTGRTDE